MKLAMVVLAASACAVVPVTAQADSTRAIVEVRGAGLVEVDPDYAELNIGIEVTARSVDAATTEMSTRLSAVSAALTRLGISPDSMPDVSFAVRPEYDFDDGRRLRGFSSDVSMTVRTRTLRDISALISAALDAGATDAGGVRFMSTQTDEARDEALQRAFEKAEREARTLALASGHALGSLIFMTTQPPASTYPALALESIVVTDLAVVIEKVRVTAEVTARWELLR